MVKSDCADYAIAFACGTDVGSATYWLWKAGREYDHDGSTDRQIASAVRALGCRMRRVKTKARTIRTFAREDREGRYLVTTTDHLVAVIDGRVCDRPEYGDLLRIEKVHKILFDTTRMVV